MFLKKQVNRNEPGICHQNAFFLSQITVKEHLKEKMLYYTALGVPGMSSDSKDMVRNFRSKTYL